MVSTLAPDCWSQDLNWSPDHPKPGFRVRPTVSMYRRSKVPGGPYGRDEFAARDKELAWFAVDDRPDFDF